MNLPRLSIGRPVAVVMMCALVVVLGIIALTETPLEMMPDIQFPVVAVVTTYEGAGPREVENLVTRPIEEAVASISGLKGIQSTSRRGTSMVLAQFEWGRDMDFAALDVREAVDRVRSLLPSDADAPLVLKFDPSAIPIMAITLGGDMHPAALRRYAEDVVKPVLERLDGVASVSVMGGLEREIQVTLHPGRMQVYGVSLDQVRGIIQGENIDVPGGTGTFREREYIVRTTGQFQNLEELADLQVPAGRSGLIALRHIAEVRDTYKDEEVFTRLNFQPAVGLSVQKEDAANTVQVARRVRDALASIMEEGNGSLRSQIVFDQAEMIEDSLMNVARNGAVGALIAGLVLLYFLRDVRATMVVAAAMPLSIVSAFVLLYFSGMTLNLISMGGLALGVGMLVDNGIVVLENIFRHRTLGLSAAEAAETGTNEVAMAITASTITTAAVFLPVVFTQGIARELFQDMAVTVAFTLAASLLVALTFVPLLASGMLRQAPDRKGSGDTAAAAVAGPMQDRYGRLLGWCLRRPRLTMAVVIVLLVLSLAFLPRIGGEFLPPSDIGIVNVTIELPVGARREDTDRVTQELERRIATLPEVEYIYARIGSSETFQLGGAQPERAIIQVTLLPLAERSRSVFEIAEVIRTWGADVPGATVSATVESGMGGGFSGAPIEIEVRGDDEDVLTAVADQVADIVRHIPGTREVKTSVQDQRPEYRIELRRARARELGLSVPQVAAAVRAAVDGDVATRYRTGGDEIDVRLRLGRGTADDLEQLRHVPVATTAAGIVPLGDVVNFTPTASPSELERRNQSRVVTVTAALFGRDLGSVMADIAAGVRQLALPAGVDIRFEGEAQQMEEAFGDLGRALVLGVFLVYAILAAQFNSYRHPLVIMFTVPLAAIGVVLGLLVTGHRFNVPSLIGLIMLAGIVVNNAIVLVDYVNTLRARGVDRDAALVEAGRTRLRPVLMTTLTTVLGMIPLALGIGEGAEMQAPLATVVIFGLTFSTVLTLVVVPIMYRWVEDIGTGALLGRLTGRGRRAPAATGTAGPGS